MLLLRFKLALFAIAVCNGLHCDLYAGPQDADLSATRSPQTIEPPLPGPELLKLTPEEIEAAYEGKKMPEAVSMYLVIVKGGQLDGTSGWFGPAIKSIFMGMACQAEWN